jgi:hypothetical protein
MTEPTIPTTGNPLDDEVDQRVPSPSGPEQEPPQGAQFSARLRGPDLLRIGVVFGALAILLVSAALTIAASPAPAASPSASQQTNPNDGNGAPGVGRRGPGFFAAPGFLGWPGFRGERGFGGFAFGPITITSIDGSKLSLKTVDGWTRTITVTDGTTITRAGQKIGLADLKVGDTIRLQQTRQSDGSFTIDAIEVVLPRVTGTVTTVSGDSFTLKSRDGTTWTIDVNGSTTYTLGSKTGAKGDVKAGAEVFVEGTQASSGNTLTAAAVHVQLPRVAGQVTAKSGNTLTVKRLDGTTVKVNVSGSTTYQVRGATSPSLSDVKVGDFIVAEGTKNSDGSIQASSVFAGAVGPRKLPGRPFAPAPNASPGASSPGG